MSGTVYPEIDLIKFKMLSEQIFFNLIRKVKWLLFICFKYRDHEYIYYFQKYGSTKNFDNVVFLENVAIFPKLLIFKRLIRIDPSSGPVTLCPKIDLILFKI